MADDRYRASAIEELPQIWDGFGKLVREGLDISAFGVQVMDLPPDYSTKSHDEGDSGQEELYIGLRGSGAVLIDDEERSLPLDVEHMVRVSPGTPRSLTSGAEGLRVLCIGGVPGGVYEPPGWTSGE